MPFLNSLFPHVTHRISRNILEDTYGIVLPPTDDPAQPPSATDFLGAYAFIRGLCGCVSVRNCERARECVWNCRLQNQKLTSKILIHYYTYWITTPSACRLYDCARRTIRGQSSTWGSQRLCQGNPCTTLHTPKGETVLCVGVDSDTTQHSYTHSSRTHYHTHRENCAMSTLRPVWTDVSSTAPTMSFCSTKSCRSAWVRRTHAHHISHMISLLCETFVFVLAHVTSLYYMHCKYYTTNT